MAAQVHRFAILRSPLLVTVLVGTLFFGMLAVFHHVVLGAVEQAELRRKDNALVIEVTRRCNAARPPLETSCAGLAKVGAGVFAAIPTSQ